MYYLTWNVSKLICFAIFSVFVMSPAQAQKDKTFIRFTENRVVRVQVRGSFQEGVYTTTCHIRQKGLNGRAFPTLRLKGDALFVRDMTTNSRGEVLLTGLVNGRISLAGMNLPSRGGWDIFYLVLDADGVVLQFERVGGSGNDRLFGAEVDAFGSFQIQAMIRERERTRGKTDNQQDLALVLLDTSLGAVVLTPHVLDDEDEEDVDDPSGKN